MSTLSAVDREVAWLQTTGDSLPSLLAADGGPWQTINAYRPRTAPTRQTAIYLLRTGFSDVRVANQRRRRTHEIRANIVWPIGATTTGMDIWETEARALDDAVDQLVTRVMDLIGDHTHGGRFLSAAEVPDRISVSFEDPERTATASPAVLLATATWSCDDFEIVI